MQALPAALFLQLTESQGTLLVIFVGIIAVCVLGLTLGLAIAGIFILRAKNAATKKINEELRKVQPLIASVRTKVDPIVARTTEVVRELTPKVQSITNDVAELSHMVRAQATDLDSTISEVTSKARSQVDRVNGMVTSTLDTTNNVVNNLERGIRVPIREVSGLLAGVKAGFEVLTSRRPQPVTSTHPVSDRIAREVHRSADAARAQAAERAHEGQTAMHTHTPVAPAVSSAPSPVAIAPRSTVEAGEEVVTGALPDPTVDRVR